MTDCVYVMPISQFMVFPGPCLIYGQGGRFRGRGSIQRVQGRQGVKGQGRGIIWRRDVEGVFRDGGTVLGGGDRPILFAQELVHAVLEGVEPVLEVSVKA